AKLVASIPGVYKGTEDIRRYGHGRLCKVIKDVCGPNENIILECQVGSGGCTSNIFVS
ncbi:3964_t:CDS:1, partial [Cetraspora pellucida]